VLKDTYFSGIKEADDPDPAPPPKKITPPKKTTTDPPIGAVPLPPMGAVPLPMGVPFPGARPLPAANIIVDTEDPKVAFRKKQDRLTIKAEATAWALYYYLSRAKPEELKAYIAELNKLPRDLPIDGSTSYNIFVRVFDLAASKGGPADPARMKKFANDWLAYISTVPQESVDVELLKTEPPKKGINDGAFPMRVDN
jgi:hypothetical protein